MTVGVALEKARSTEPARSVRRSPAAAQDLLDLARSGDPEAFEELYRANVGRIYALCLRLSRNPDRAEELTQDCFVRAWRKLHLFRGESAFSTWLHRLSVNVVLAENRMLGRLRRRIEALIASHPPEPRARPVDRGLGIDLERALAALSDRARTVFVLHEIEGYRHREISRLLGISTGTSKTHLHRARARLREELHEEDPRS